MLDPACSKLAVAQVRNKSPQVAADSKQVTVTADIKLAAGQIDSKAVATKIRTKSSNLYNVFHLQGQDEKHLRLFLSKWPRR